jgi:uncharacterized protein (TIGR02246 family)
VSNLAVAEQMIAAYNAQDVDAYVALMTDDAAEASYRGAVLRDGKEGVRSGLAQTFAEFPENRAEIIERQVLGDYVMFLERVWRTAAGEPFDVLAIYSFEGGKCSRVEFIR